MARYLGKFKLLGCGQPLALVKIVPDDSLSGEVETRTDCPLYRQLKAVPDDSLSGEVETCFF